MKRCVRTPPALLVLTFLLSALTITPPGAAAGRSYYVAPQGSDSAAGTNAAPWASITHAQSVAGAGDTVYFRDGTYAYTRAVSGCKSQTDKVDAITLNKSGSSGSPIRYMAYPGENPVFVFSRMTPVANDFFNNTSYGNRPDFNMLGVDPSGAAVGRGNLRNNVAYTGSLTSNMSGTNATYNSWNLGVTLSDSQFQSVSTSGWDASRQADGGLPDTAQSPSRGEQQPDR